MKNRVTSLDSNRVLVAPSILAADFADLEKEIKRVETAGADLIHVDVMDGHFVPNISIGPPVVKSIRKTTSLPFDVHLMISEPMKYISPFADAGADHITFHIESDGDPDTIINEIRRKECSVGISLKPATPAEAVIPFLNRIDMVLVMTVEPGFGGQSFMSDMMPKVRELRTAIDSSERKIHLEVDGGIDGNTVDTVVSAGANMLVAGTFVFRHPESAESAIKNLH